MFKMFAQLFNALCVLFSSVETMSRSIDNLAKAGEILSEGVLDRTRAENQAELIALKQQLKLPAAKA